MKKLVLVGLFVVLCSGMAEAGVLSTVGHVLWHPVTSVKNFMQYAISPINCLGNLGKAMLWKHDGGNGELPVFAGCVASNMNVNPVTLDGPLVNF